MSVRQIVTFLSSTLVFLGCNTETKKEFIAVNLVGYDVRHPKQAFLVNSRSDSFELLEEGTLEVAFSGKIMESLPPDLSTGDSLSVIDFSDFTGSGRYILRTKGEEKVLSHPFSVGQNVYKEVVFKGLQSFYYNRCGTAVDNGEIWSHPVCHITDGVYYANSTTHRDVTGGWHDAGDYNKYAINTELSVGLLLYLYEMRPELLTDGQLKIPESENGIPDLLDEARWTLVWLMKMQGEDGSVYHKVSQKKWIGEFLPQKDPATRFIFTSSSNATAGFAAVAALGAQQFKMWDPAFSARLAQKSLKAWKFLKRHPVIKPLGGFKNPPDVVGGEYGDYSDTDTRLWAAIELYKLTGETDYLDFFIENYQGIDIVGMPPLSWKEFSSLALFSFLNAQLPSQHVVHKQHILGLLKKYAENLEDRYEESNYRTLLNHTEYYWGSNSVALGKAFILIGLYQHTGNETYFRMGLDQLHYNLGRNPFNKSFVTGVGASSVYNPYHQFSMKLNSEEPVPGMLVGGPNNHILLNGETISEYPGKNYEDSELNYYVNEVAINWTAIMAYTAGFFLTAREVTSN